MLTIDELVDQMKRKVEVAYKTGARHATEIFEDGQSKRVCVNCRYGPDDDGELMRLCPLMFLAPNAPVRLGPPPDFGCNRFEKKD